jgi:hypothetical protein
LFRRHSRRTNRLTYPDSDSFLPFLATSLLAAQARRGGRQAILEELGALRPPTQPVAVSLTAGHRRRLRAAFVEFEQSVPLAHKAVLGRGAAHASDGSRSSRAAAFHGGLAFNHQCSQLARLGAPWLMRSPRARELQASRLLQTAVSVADELLPRMAPRKELLARRQLVALLPRAGCGRHFTSASLFISAQGSTGVTHVDRNWGGGLSFSFDVGGRRSDATLRIGKQRFKTGTAVFADYGVPHRMSEQTKDGAIRVSVALYHKARVARTVLPRTAACWRAPSAARRCAPCRVAVWFSDVRDRNPRWFAGSIVDRSIATGMYTVRFDDGQQLSLDLHAQAGAGLARRL